MWTFRFMATFLLVERRSCHPQCQLWLLLSENLTLSLSQLIRCMETTPSLACANKCVFCWRHHTNPVGKSWQWKMDDPLVIVNSAIELHTKMIRQMKGVPGRPGVSELV